MSEDLSFCELVRRVRARDEWAAAELVRRYQPVIRVAIRVRLTALRLRRILDSEDVCQSVLGEFFARAADGQFDLDRPEQLLHLLKAMAHNWVTNEALKQRAACRDLRRVQYGLPEEEVLRDPEPTPSQQAETDELAEVVRSRLTAQELEVAEQRAEGRDWAEIAAAVGANADALRMRFRRALVRVAHELSVG